MSFKLGQKVIINTGGKDSEAIIDYPTVLTDRFGQARPWFWESQDAYLCRFTTDIKHTHFGGAVSGSHDEKNYLAWNAQYIPTKYIRASE